MKKSITYYLFLDKAIRLKSARYELPLNINDYNTCGKKGRKIVNGTG